MDEFMNFFAHALNTVMHKFSFQIIVAPDFLLGRLSHKWTSQTDPSLLLWHRIWPLVWIFLFQPMVIPILRYDRYGGFSLIYWAAGGTCRCAVRFIFFFKESRLWRDFYYSILWRNIKSIGYIPIETSNTVDLLL